MIYISTILYICVCVCVTWSDLQYGTTSVRTFWTWFMKKTLLKTLQKLFCIHTCNYHEQLWIYSTVCIQNCFLRLFNSCPLISHITNVLTEVVPYCISGHTHAHTHTHTHTHIYMLLEIRELDLDITNN